LSLTLANKKYWNNSWGNLPPEKTYQVLTQYFDYINTIKKIYSAIEFGGYPCNYLIYLKKKFNCKIYCIDYAINKFYLKKLFYKNNLNFNRDIKLIKKDITTNIKIKKKFDLVYSLGLVEHFDSLDYIIKKHLYCLKENGVLYFTMPNLCGLNGLIMKLLDKKTFETHNVKSMNIKKIKRILKKNNLKLHILEYASSNGIFITNLKNKNLFIRFFIKIVHIFTKVITFFFLKKSKLFSNDIICISVKKY
jgi:SAM-dependent methyltransferase